MNARDDLPRVHVFGLGGTIAMAPQTGGGVVPSLAPQTLLAAVPQLADVAAIDASDFRQMPGGHLGFADLEALAAAIEAKAAEGIDGIVVTQGTDTIEETAFVLDRLVDASIPVVMTGAMRNPALPSADGPANLLAAVRVACEPAARGMGCVVVMNDEVHAARFVRKLHTSQLDAFGSPRSGPIGWLTEDRVSFMAQLPRLRPIRRSPTPEPAKVALITLALDDDGSLIRLALRNGYSGIVVAALGGGHCTPAAADAIEEATAQVDVILSTRVQSGEVLTRTYGFVGSEMDLLRRGARRSASLDAPKVRALLTLLQRHGDRGEAIDAAFADY